MCEYCIGKYINNPRDMHGGTLLIHGKSITKGDEFYADYYKMRMTAQFVSGHPGAIYVSANGEDDKMQLTDKRKNGMYIPFSLCRPIVKNKVVQPKCVIYPVSKRDEIQLKLSQNYKK